MVTPRAAFVAGAVVAAAFAGCLAGIDDSLVSREPRDAAPDGGAAAAADAPADTPDASDAADAGCPHAMVLVPAPGDAGARPFCVDATEVTSGAYKAFLAAAEPPAAGSQIAECSWNTSYQPPGWTGTEADDHPAAAIDWCDAYAFCKWAGKRLCGAVGGGAVDPNGGGGTLASEWFVACSRGGTRVFPYGSSYDPQACVGALYDAGAMTPPLAAGAASGCQGGYAGLFDMAGNVEELIDSCTTTPDPSCGSGGPDCDLCLLMGGGFLSGADGGWNIACPYANEVWRKSTYVDDGFRCCADGP